MPKIRMADGDWSRNLWNRIRSLISGLDNRVTSLEQGGGGGGGGGDVNVIEAISFNGVNVPPDSAKRVSLQEADPTVPAWAKAANKPTYTAAEVGALPDNTPVPVTSGGTGANNAASARTNLGVPSTSEMTAAIGQAIEDVIEYVNIGAEDMLVKIAQMSADKMIYFRTTSTTTNGPRSGVYLIGTAVRAGNNITITASEMTHPETIYQNSTTNAGSTWVGWSEIGCAVFNSATPSTVYTTLSSIGIGKSMPFIITNSDAASFLTGGKSTSLLKGIVARTGATGTLYDFISGAGGNQYMYTWRVTATSAADITPGTVYRYTGTAI